MAFGAEFVFLFITFHGGQSFAAPERWPRWEKSLNINSFERYVDELPILPRIKVDKNQTELTITLNQLTASLHRDLPSAQFWGYNGMSPGPVIEVEKGQKVTVHWKSELPTTHLLKMPKTMDMGGPAMPDVRSVTHLHGAVVTQSEIIDSTKKSADHEYDNDGWPDSWITPGQEQLAEYPNNQDARILWYHDHAMSETGRNVAAGLFGMYLIHDDYERSLKLPDGAYDIPMVIQARGVNGDGSLYYTSDLTSEFYGNALAVNGKLWPKLTVEPRKYRFRMLNVSNARSVLMRLVDFTTQAPGPAFYQIGTDAGFLQNTAVLNNPSDPNALQLMLAPAERADVIIDFSKFAGKKFLMQNNAKPDAGDSVIPIGQVMVIQVGTKVTQADTSKIPMKMRPISKLKVADAQPKARQIVLTINAMNMVMLNGKLWHDPIEEKPVLGTTEVWNLVNTLPDTHPFHIHLVQFQILDRRPFDAAEYLKTGVIKYTGPAQPPDINELGWKDVVRANPEAVTRIIMKFEPYTGYYVYHCHILEHEDMDMMRPFQVVAPLAAPLRSAQLR